MNIKKIITAILILFVVASVVYFIVKEVQDGPANASETTNEGTDNNQSNTNDDSKVIVYYFYTTYRCHSCNLIEQYTRDAVQNGFSEEIQNEQVEFSGVNIQEPQNEHFIQDYQLAFKTVVMSKIVNGEEVDWKKLDQVWEYLRDQNQFTSFIQNEVRVYLEGS